MTKGESQTRCITRFMLLARASHNNLYRKLTHPIFSLFELCNTARPYQQQLSSNGRSQNVSRRGAQWQVETRIQKYKLFFRLRNFACIFFYRKQYHIRSLHNIYIFSARKRDNCECIVTWGRPSHASPLPLKLRRHAKVWVAEPIHCRIIAFLLRLYYFTL